MSTHVLLKSSKMRGLARVFYRGGGGFATSLKNSIIQENEC